MLTIAIQKSGRLHDNTIKLFNECGLTFHNGGHHRLKMQATNFPLQVLFSRDDDIPVCIDDGAADAGIVGENVYIEKNKKLAIAQKECNESIYWLELLKETDYLNVSQFEILNDDSIELLKIITSSIKTVKSKLKIKH